MPFGTDPERFSGLEIKILCLRIENLLQSASSRADDRYGLTFIKYPNVFVHFRNSTKVVPRRSTGFRNCYNTLTNDLNVTFCRQTVYEIQAAVLRNSRSRRINSEASFI